MFFKIRDYLFLLIFQKCKNKEIWLQDMQFKLENKMNIEEWVTVKEKKYRNLLKGPV